MAQQPLDGHLPPRVAGAFAQPPVALEQIPVHARQLGGLDGTHPPLAATVAGVLAREESVGQREVGEDAEPQVHGRRKKVVFDVAGQKRVFVLGRDEGLEALRHGNLCGLARHVPGEVGVPDEANLALAHQVRQDLQGLLNGGLRIRGVHLQEVDPVRLEPRQGGLDGRADIAPRALRAPSLGAGHREVLMPEFGGHHHLIPFAPQRNAEELLAASRGTTVDVGAVEERDSLVDGCADDPHALLKGLRGGSRPGEVVAPHPDDADLQP